MPNRNYIKGRKKEYAIRNKLLKEGWDIVQRTAGSHSPIDIIAVNKKERKILFVQSKPGNYAQSRINKLNQELSWLNNKFICSFVVI